MKKRIASLVMAIKMMALMMSFGGVAFAKITCVRTLAAQNPEAGARVKPWDSRTPQAKRRQGTTRRYRVGEAVGEGAGDANFGPFFLPYSPKCLEEILGNPYTGS